MYDNNRERFENLWMRPWIMYCIVNIYSSVVTIVQTLHASSANNYKLLVYRTSRNFEHTQTKVFYLHYRTVLQYKC